jgi:hypothetical protein
VIGVPKGRLRLWGSRWLPLCVGALIGMLVVETVAKIRRAYFVQGKSIKAICRELRISRKVVRKVLRSEATEFRYKRGEQSLPRIGPWQDALDQLLAFIELLATGAAPEASVTPGRPLASFRHVRRVTLCAPHCTVLHPCGIKARRRFTRTANPGAKGDRTRLKQPYATTTSIQSVSLDSMFRFRLNPVDPPWHATRSPGGVGGAAP